MTRISTLRLGAQTLLMSTLSCAALAQGLTRDTELAPIDVEQDTAVQTTPSRYVFKPEDLAVPPAIDTGDLLRDVPGVTAGRMGGRGIDIVIRGQQQNQISVIDAGSVTYGACPNRMDPPTSSAALARADRIIVQRGYASVTNGPGATGGAVILERARPEFRDDLMVSGQLRVGGISNSETFDTSGLLSFDLGKGFYAQIGGGYATANDYEDGSGKKVRSGYDQYNHGVTVGYARNGVDIALDVEKNKTKNVRFAGGMDSPEDKVVVYRLRGSVDVDMGALRRIEGNAWLSEVDHVMDNYSNRNVGMMAMRTPTASDTWGGKIAGHLEFGTTRATVGVDIQSNNRKATSYMGMAGMIPMIEAEAAGLRRAYLWPDVTIRQIGFFLETETDLRPGTMLKTGLRYDRVRAKANRADDLPAGAMQRPNDFYQAQYGTTFNRARHEDNIGGLIRIEQELNQNTLLFAGLSRAVRTADASERAMGRATWVGNPDIKPEKHHQFDIGIETGGAGWDFSAAAYWDEVDDFILRDQFSVSGVTTYRNVNARLMGVEIGGGFEHNGFEVNGNATYTYGENRSDDRHLAQIPPLFGQVTAAYGQDLWQVGARMNWSLKQTRIDRSRDPQKTPGWATFDLFGRYDVNDMVQLRAGVDNVFDKTYANHISRVNLFDNDLTQVNEPGRRFYAGLEAKF